MGAFSLQGIATAVRTDLRMLRRSLSGVDRRRIVAYLRDAQVRRLQIGAGLNPREGWLNTNYRPGRQDPVIHLDATLPFPLPDASFDYIFSEHMIEHIGFAEGQAMLRECARVLRPGGRLRLSTPDLAFLIGLQAAELTPLQHAYIDWALRDQQVPATARHAAVLNRFVRTWGHVFIYDRASLIAAMAAAGFVAVRSYPIDISDDTELVGLENAGRMPDGMLQLESMTFEAVKATG